MCACELLLCTANLGEDLITCNLSYLHSYKSIHIYKVGRHESERYLLDWIPGNELRERLDAV